MNKVDIKKNVSRPSIWMRLVYMIVIAIAYTVAEIVGFAVVVFQFLSSLFTGKPSDRLAHFGRNLARYYQQIVQFMTFVTDERPFPFAPWPAEPHDELPAPPAPDSSDTSGDDPETPEDTQEDAAAAKPEPKKRSTRKPAAKTKPRAKRKPGA